MSRAQDIQKLFEGAEVNYTVSAILYFDDGINKGNLKVRATDAADAHKKASEQLHKTWAGKSLKKIEILKVKKG